MTFWKYAPLALITIILAASFSGCAEDNTITGSPNNPPNTITMIAPATGDTVNASFATLRWSCSDDDGDTLTYNVYVDTTINPGFVGNSDLDTFFVLTTLEANHQYYWKVVALDGIDSTISGLSSFYFTGNSAPSTPSDPVPADGDTVYTATTTLRWTSTDPDPGDSLIYNIYFGTASNPPLVYEGWHTNSYPTDSLEFNQDYYWKIIAIDTEGDSARGPEWSFATAENIRPEINFPQDFIDDYMSAEFYSFDHCTFGWELYDSNGTGTIASVEYYVGTDAIPLDSASLDTLTWLEMFSVTDEITLYNISPGNKRFFLKTTDEAGGVSDIIYYPDTLGRWTVTAPTGDVLYVDDNPATTGSENSYEIVLDSLYGPSDYSTWIIEDLTYYYESDIVQAISSFDVIIWNSGNISHFGESNAALKKHVQEGGKLLLITNYANWNENIYGFMPADSITGKFISDEIRDFRALASGYPDLDVTTSVAPLFSFAPGAPEYLADDSTAAIYDVPVIADSNIFGARYPATGTAQVIMLSFHAHNCWPNGGFGQMMQFILWDEFDHTIK
ncbi:MAG: hypothetical protein GF307_02605 [candidate division Zixibacteria bacterium]|nr:hypothetical protein [candidate division Zixibacteria bacterium]